MIPGIVAQNAPTEEAGGEVDPTVSLLLGFNGTHNTARFVDEGPRTVPYGTLGDVHLSNVQSKFGGTSARFDGSNDGITYPFNEGFEFGSGPFTVEGWFYPTTNNTEVLACSRVDDTLDTLSWSIAKVNGTSRNLELIWNNGSVLTNVTGTGTATLNGWNHFALCRGTDGIVRLFLNGVLQVSISNATAGTLANPKRFPVSIGIITSKLTADFTGFIDEVRIKKGEAVYDSAATFTPPALPFSRPAKNSLTPDADANFANVLLLLGFDSSSPYDVRDDSSYGRKATRWNVGSLNDQVQRGIADRPTELFPIGNTSYLQYDDSDQWAFGTDAFTVEFWLKPMKVNGFSQVIGQRNAGSTPVSWVLTTLNATSSIEYIAAQGATISQFDSGANTLHSYTWNHVALSRDSSGVFRLFVNGVMRAKDTTKPTLSIANIVQPLTIGSGFNGGNILDGNLDEVRVTRGFCRYASDASFYPSLKPFSRNEAGKPVFSVEPSITSNSGFYAVGDVLTIDRGTSNGFEPAVQWRRDGVPIVGATGGTYTLAGADVGAAISASVKVWNYSGETTAIAPATPLVAATPAYQTDPLAPGGDMQSGGDRLIPAGDMQSGGDLLIWKERIQ